MRLNTRPNRCIMNVSRKTDYALRALTSLAANPQEPQSIRRLAQANQIPKRFLEQIMLQLKDQGWVEGTQGRLGGYHLTVSPHELTVGMVGRFFDGMLAPISCVSVYQPTHCPLQETCTFRDLFLQIRNNAADLLDKTPLSALTSPAENKT